MTYQPDNVFAKILRGEIPCHKVYEDDVVLAFHDISPRAKIHVLVIPKGPYTSSDHFHEAASDKEIVGYYRALQKIVDLLGLKTTGYRLLSNVGADSGQEVPHFHTHIFGGQPLGPMLSVKKQS